MCLTPPRFSRSFSRSAWAAIRSRVGSSSRVPSSVHSVSSWRRLIRLEIVSKLVRRPPSQRWFTYGMPAAEADSAIVSRACFFVPTNKTVPPRLATFAANS